MAPCAWMALSITARAMRGAATLIIAICCLRIPATRNTPREGTGHHRNTGGTGSVCGVGRAHLATLLPTVSIIEAAYRHKTHNTRTQVSSRSQATMKGERGQLKGHCTLTWSVSSLLCVMSMRESAMSIRMVPA